MAALGSVGELWRFPMKSMQGEQLESAGAGERGLRGDRVWALIDTATGKVVSAKNPRKWPGLLDWSARFLREPGADGAPPPVRVVFPNGSAMASDDPGFEARVSAALGREVTIACTPVEAPVLEEYWPDIEGLANRETVTDETMSSATPVGTFFDCAPIHVVTAATLAALARGYPDGRFDPRRFRANIVVETRGEGFPENDWVGRSISIGGEVVLEILSPCPRCVMTILKQGDLPLDPGILKTVARLNNAVVTPPDERLPSVGVYAKVMQGGTVRRGDALRFV